MAKCERRRAAERRNDGMGHAHGLERRAGRIPWRDRWRRSVSRRGCHRVSFESGDGRAGPDQDLSCPSRRRYLPANDLLHINGVFKLFLGLQIHDVNSKPKIIRREKYELLNLESDDWFADAEIMIRAKQAGLSIGEIPVHFALNETRGSFVKPRAIFEFMSNLIRYRFGSRKGHPGHKDVPDTLSSEQNNRHLTRRSSGS